MEIELKYTLPETVAAGDVLSADILTPMRCGVTTKTSLHAIYYDTSDGVLEQVKAALRMRLEGDTWVCCFKQAVRDENGLSRRVELEQTAADLPSGIRGLLRQGAPEALLMPCLDGAVVTAETKCVRTAVILSAGGTKMELALDEGSFPLSDGSEVPFRELELELKDGPEGPMVALGQALAERFGLTAEPRSKYARALALRRDETRQGGM